ncbi:MAG: zinc ribbon domain-containing protein [Promethearchaeota archaeon]
MLLDENEHHMMDWIFWGNFNWLVIISALIIFFILIIIILYALKRNEYQETEYIQAKPTNNQNLGLSIKIDGIKDEKLNFCPNCGAKISKSFLKYCSRCGFEFKQRN